MKKNIFNFILSAVFLTAVYGGIAMSEDIEEERCEYPVWSVKSEDTGSERIAYALVSKIYGTQIWTVRADDNKHRIMLTSVNWNRHPSWNWDGKRIVYAGGDAKNVQQIFIMNEEGSEQVQLTDTSEDKLYPVFSPKGDKIAYVSFKKNEAFIYELDISAKTKKEPVKLIKCGNIGKDTVLSPIAYSPDGKSIAFVKLDPDYKNENIFILDLQTKKEKQATSKGYVGSGLSWSPDNSKLVYTSPSNSGRGFSLYILNLENNETKEFLTNITPLGVCWSPDNKKVCFLRNYQIWTADTDGKTQKQITAREIVVDLKGWEIRKKQNMEAVLKLREFVGKKVWLRKTIFTTSGEKLEKLLEADIINVRNKIMLPEKYRVLDDSRLTIEIELRVKGKRFFVVYLNEITGYIDDFSRFFFLSNPYTSYNWGQDIWDAIKNRKVLLGMNKTQVLLALGEPSELLKSGQAVNELWVYKFVGTISFQDDIVKEFKPAGTAVEIKNEEVK